MGSMLEPLICPFKLCLSGFCEAMNQQIASLLTFQFHSAMVALTLTFLLYQSRPVSAKARDEGNSWASENDGGGSGQW